MSNEKLRYEHSVVKHSVKELRELNNWKYSNLSKRQEYCLAVYLAKMGYEVMGKGIKTISYDIL